LPVPDFLPNTDDPKTPCPAKKPFWELSESGKRGRVDRLFTRKPEYKYIYLFSCCSLFPDKRYIYISSYINKKFYCGVVLCFLTIDKCKKCILCFMTSYMYLKVNPKYCHHRFSRALDLFSDMFSKPFYCQYHA
jgi:hypothetical protein